MASGLAPRAGHGGDADVDVLAAEADADAAVHREALLGDVEVGHDLDAGDDRALEAVQLRRHVHLVQHAVDAVADAQLRLLRLDVDVRRALAIGLGDDPVHELDDGGLLALGPHVDLRDGALLVVHRVAAVLDHLLDRVRAHAVELLDRLVDLLRGREDRLHRTVRREAQAVPRHRRERVAHGHRELAAVEPERHRVVLVDGARRQFLKHVRTRLHLLKVNVGEAKEVADFLEELRLLHAAELDRRLRKSHVGVRLALRGNAGESLVGIEAGRLEDVERQSGCFSHGWKLYHKFAPRGRLTNENTSDILCRVSPCGRNSMAEFQPSKLATRVRFPSPAPFRGLAGVA